MSVRRELSMVFEASPSEVIAAAREVFSKPPYRHMREVSSGGGMTVVVQPRWWMLPTTLVIEAKQEGEGSCVVARTTSQWFIYGDVLDYYHRYILNALGGIASRLGETLALRQLY